MKPILHINGLAVDVELGTDWKGRDVWFATIDGQRKSFWSDWAAMAWIVNAMQRRARH